MAKTELDRRMNSSDILTQTEPTGTSSLRVVAKASSNTRVEMLVLLGILGIAFGLRIWGINFGLPYRYHPDEPQHVAEAARMLVEHRLEPQIFNNPPFYKYLLVLADAGYAGVSLLLGRYESLSELASSLSWDPSPLYLLGRVVSVIAGTLTVLITYFIGKAAYTAQVGLLSSFFLAVSFLHVRDSHFAVNDALLVLLVATAVLAAIKVIQYESPLWGVIGAGSAGLAFATKYTAVFVIFTLTVAVIIAFYKDRTRKLRARLGMLVAIWSTFGLAAVFGSPYFLLKPVKVYQSISGSIYAYGVNGFEGWQLDAAGAYLYYLKSLVWGMGPVLALLALLGCFLALARHTKAELVLLTYPILLYLFMTRQEMYFARFLLPAYPALLVLAASCASAFISYIGERAFLTPGKLLLVVAVAAALPPAIQSARLGYLLAQTDTRTLAKQWVEQNIPEGAKIAVDWPHHGPPLSTLASPEPDSARAYELMVVGGMGLAEHSLGYYRSQGIHHLISSSNISNIALTNVEQEGARHEFYVQLDTELELLQEFTPHPPNADPPFVFDQVLGPMLGLWQIERPGPTIKIYGFSE